MLQTILRNSIAHGALAGLGGAVLVDVRIFMTYTDPAQVKTWQWKVALMRWVQGAIGGALMGAGISAVS